MRFKLEECLDVRLVGIFFQAGHDVQTVYQEKLSGVTDEDIYSACVKDQRTLIT